MTDLQLMELAIKIMRSTRSNEVIDLVSEVQLRLSANLLPAPPKPKFDRNAYQRNYMRQYRKKNANPFG